MRVFIVVNDYSNMEQHCTEEIMLLALTIQ